jgi:hypothetical protein
VFSIIGSFLLVLAVLLFWGLRQKTDLTGALLAALCYGAFMPPTGYLANHAASVAWAAVLLACVAFTRHITPLSRAALIGVGAGSVLGDLAAFGTHLLFGWDLSVSFRWVAWMVAKGVIAGFLAAAAVRWLKLDDAPNAAVAVGAAGAPSRVGA